MREVQVQRRIRHALIALIVAAVVGTPLGALDLGGNINSQSNLENATPAFRNSLSMYLRRNPEASPDGTLRWVVEGSVSAITTDRDGHGLETLWVPDVNLARIETIHPGVLGAPQSALRTAGGRITFSEPTNLIYADRIDGLRVGFEFPRVSITAGGGYTGLIPGANSGVVMSADDAIARENPGEYAGARRVVATASIAAPELLGLQRVTAGGLAQFDARGRYISERLNSQYAFLQLDGPLVGSVYSEIAGAASFVQRTQYADFDIEVDSESSVGVAGRVQTRAYLGANDASVVTASARYASGDGEPFGAFTPATAPAVRLLGPVRMSNLALFKLDYAFRPFAGRPGSQARSLELSAYGAVDLPADFDAEGGFRGIEAGARTTLRFLSDVGGRIWAGAYIPGEEDADVQFLGRLDLSTSF